MKVVASVACISLTSVVVFAAQSTTAQIYVDDRPARVVYSNAMPLEDRKTISHSRSTLQSLDNPGRVGQFRKKAYIQPTLLRENANISSTPPRSSLRHNRWISFLHTTSTAETGSDEDESGDAVSSGDSTLESGRPESTESHAESSTKEIKSPQENDNDEEGGKASSTNERVTTPHSATEGSNGRSIESGTEDQSTRQINTKGEAPPHGSAPMKTSTEENTTGEHTHSDVNVLIKRLTSLLQGSKSKEVLSSLSNLVSIHERAESAQKKLDEEAKATARQENADTVPKEQTTIPEDLLLNQQLNNMWVLRFNEEQRREHCLSGFETLAKEARISCSDSSCFRLEKEADACSYMSIDSILRKDDLPEPKRSVEGEPHHEQKDHLLLGFDGQCKKAEELGTRILSIMQHPRSTAQDQKRAQSIGLSTAVNASKHHLDVICNQTSEHEYPACKAVYQALEHFSERGPKAPPELLLLTDVKDLENTLALYRVAVIFEALVPFQAADGTPIDVNQHRLSAKDAAFLKEHRSADISQTVLSASK